MKQKIIVSLLIAMLPLALFAHAPKKVLLEYDKDSGNLSVSISHPVKNVEDHHIESLVISVNGEEKETMEYTVQSSLEEHLAEIELPGLKAGDQVSAKATCNKVGSKTGKLEIE